MFLPESITCALVKISPDLSIMQPVPHELNHGIDEREAEAQRHRNTGVPLGDAQGVGIGQLDLAPGKHTVLDWNMMPRLKMRFSTYCALI